MWYVKRWGIHYGGLLQLEPIKSRRNIDDNQSNIVSAGTYILILSGSIIIEYLFSERYSGVNEIKNNAS